MTAAYLKVFHQLDSVDEQSLFAAFSEKIKGEIQGADGLLKLVRERDERTQIAAKRKILSQMQDVSDSSIEATLSALYEENEKSLSVARYDFVHAADLVCEAEDYPSTREALDFILRSNASLRDRLQVHSVLKQHINMSVNQARKSQAGQAAQSVMEQVFRVAGLERDSHFSTQFRTSEGSSADFVLPAVKKGAVEDITTMVACQISSNDRWKLILGELLEGRVTYVASFNGFSASTKKLSNIGSDHIKKAHQKAIRIVCGSAALAEERVRIDEAMKAKTPGALLPTRKEYFEKYALTFEQFVAQLRS